MAGNGSLADLYDWFTEGFDTADLKDAKALLDEVSCNAVRRHHLGAGSWGAVMASRLSENTNRSVLLLDAGPDYRTMEETPHDLLRTMFSLANHDWGWTARATPDREIAFARGKVTGGCSAVNASIAIRGVPADFDEWAALDNDEWSFAKVLPFYRKLEHDVDFGGDVHGKGGPIWIERSKEESERHFARQCDLYSSAGVNPEKIAPISCELDGLENGSRRTLPRPNGRGITGR